MAMLIDRFGSLAVIHHDITSMAAIGCEAVPRQRILDSSFSVRYANSMYGTVTSC